MGEAGLAFADLDRIAVTVGPGSFTGLRVGIAAARGFGLVTGCELVGIGTLDVHAAEAQAIAPGRPVLVLLDARRDEVYGQLFDADGSPAGEAAVADAAVFARRLPADAVLAGSGAARVAALRARRRDRPYPLRARHRDARAARRRRPPAGRAAATALSASARRAPQADKKVARR